MLSQFLVSIYSCVFSECFLCFCMYYYIICLLYTFCHCLYVFYLFLCTCDILLPYGVINDNNNSRLRLSIAVPLMSDATDYCDAGRRQAVINQTARPAEIMVLPIACCCIYSRTGSPSDCHKSLSATHLLSRLTVNFPVVNSTARKKTSNASDIFTLALISLRRAPLKAVNITRLKLYGRTFNSGNTTLFC